MKVVVAGGSGFVGRHVVAALLERGHTVVALGRGRREAPAGAVHVSCDAARDPIPAAVFAGASAVVNLVGIKRPDGTQTFATVHEDVTRALLDAARTAGARRFIHVSVVGSRPDPTSPYHDTKWRAEALVRESGLAFTILRPGVIYGAGDDMLTHLVKMIRFAPLFPIVGRGASRLQPVDVRDVAAAAVAALERPAAVGRAYDVVGPERFALRTIVRTVARGLGLPLLIVPTPVALMRPIVAAMSSLFRAPLSTPSQLRMLEDGMVGDPEPARRDLGVEPRGFSIESVRAVAAPIPPLFGVSLRLAPGGTHRIWLDGLGRGAGAAALVVLVAVVGSLVLAALSSNVWYRMAAAGAGLIALALALVPLPWRALFRPTAAAMGLGAALAAAMYAVGALVYGLLTWFPAAAAQVATLYAWRDAIPAWSVLPLVLFIVAAEEIVWRAAVTLPLAGRFGPWIGSILAAVGFALAHVALGVPLLVVVAFAAGWFWSALVLQTRSAVPALVSHLLWDIAVLVVLPYPQLFAAVIKALD